MSKPNQRILLFTVLYTFLSALAFGQKSYTEKHLTHKVIVDYDDHTVVAYVKPVRNLKVASNKLYYWFSAKRINTTQGGYSGKLLNGDYQDFYRNKNLKESGIFNAGLKEGKWKVWNETGVLREEYTWNSGKRNGIYAKYDSLGRLAETGQYHNNLLSGIQKTFVGDSTNIVYYKEGKVAEKKQFIPGFIKRNFSKKAKVKKDPSLN